MTNIAGVDGCPFGWIALVEQMESRRITAHVFETFGDLVEALDAIVIAIDIPIGLTDSGARQCDVQARQHLGAKRGTSVFPAPIRPVLQATTYPEATAMSMAVQKKGISQQAWAIYPKICQVDQALRRDTTLRRRVVEVHPELTFSTWARSPIVPGKRTPAGHAIRRDLIAAHFGPIAFDTARAAVNRSSATNDDIADAFAGLWTAERVVAGTAKTLPVEPSVDSCGLPMQMVY